MNTQTITLSGLHCEACTKVSVRRLGKIEGVTSATPTDEMGVFTVDSEQPLSSEHVNKVLEGTEYTLESIT